MTTKIYLDVCTFCRPFDDQSQVRIRMERDAYFLIVRAIEGGRYIPIISPVHLAEVESIAETSERLEILELFRRLRRNVTVKPGKLRARAEELTTWSFGTADAAHVAFAETTADAFITCDDRLLKKCRAKRIALPVFNPVEFVSREGLQ